MIRSSVLLTDMASIGLVVNVTVKEGKQKEFLREIGLVCLRCGKGMF